MEFAKSLMAFQQSSTSLLLLIYSSVFAFILSLIILANRIVNTRKGENLPPGRLGLPLIGETFQFLSAQQSHRGKEWLEEKVAKYGRVFKTSLMGSPIVVLTGQAGNRFLLQHDYTTIVMKQPITVSRIAGKYNISELRGEDHKRMRGALMQFLKPEALQKFVGRIELVILQHLADSWEGKDIITVWPSMKKLTFQVACDLLFGLSLKHSEDIEILANEFTTAVKGFWSLPLNLPGTAFRRGLNARSNVCKRLSSLLEERRRELHEGKSSPGQDLMSCMLSTKDENGKALTEEEIVDSMISVMIAGHDTTSCLLTLLIRRLTLDPKIYHNILQEQMEVMGGREPNEPLTWGDIQKMKYTWRVAQEELRLTPIVYGGFRTSITNIEYGGYTIPKGWQLFWVASSTHMNEEIFKEPNKFDPSNFENPIPPYSFLGFGGGPRLCPGNEFAKMETLVILHHLVCKYNWSLINSDEKLKYDPMPVPVMGLPIKLQSKYT